MFTSLAAARSLKIYEPPQLALATHPDKNPDNEEATQQFQQIGEAYHVIANYLDKPAHRHEYADPFDPYDDDDEDDEDEGDGGYFFYDLEELQFYLWVVPHASFFENRLLIPRSFMYEQMLGGGRRPFRMRYRNTLTPGLFPYIDISILAFFHHRHFHENRDHRNYIPRSRGPRGSSGEARFRPDYSRDTSGSPRETPEQAAARRAEETARAKERMKQQRENGSFLVFLN